MIEVKCDLCGKRMKKEEAVSATVRTLDRYGKKTDHNFDLCNGCAFEAKSFLEKYERYPAPWKEL